MLGSITFTLQIRHIGAGNMESAGPLSLADQKFTKKARNTFWRSIVSEIKSKVKRKMIFLYKHMCMHAHTHIHTQILKVKKVSIFC